MPLPRRPGVDLLRVPAPAARRRCGRPATWCAGSTPHVIVGFGGYVSMPAVRRRPPDAACRWSSTKATPARGSPTVSARASAPTWSPPRSLTPACLTRRSPACPSAGRSPRLTGQPCDRAPARTSVSTRTLPTLLVTGGSQGAARHQRRRGGRGARPSREAGVQVLHVAGPKGTCRSAGGPRRRSAAVRRRALRRPDGACVRGRRRDGWQGWRKLGHRGGGARAARGLRAAADRQRRAAAERAAVVQAGGAVLVDEQGLHTELGRLRTVPELLSDTDGLGWRDGAGGSRPGARRRGRSGRARWSWRGRAMIIPVPDRSSRQRSSAPSTSSGSAAPPSQGWPG